MEVDNAAEKIVQHLEDTKSEIEQFIYELSLESTDAEARYERLKHELKSSVEEIRQSLDRKDLITEESAKALENKLSAIEIHLRKPSGNALERTKQFLRVINGAIKEVKNALGKEGSVSEFLERTYTQLQRYKLKFEIMKLRLALGNLKVKYAGEEMQHELKQKIEQVSRFIQESRDEAEEGMRKFRLMVNKIYSDVGKIFN